MDSIEVMQKKRQELEKKFPPITTDDKPLEEAIKKGKALMTETKGEPE
jgi:hypothetical protein